MEDRANKVNTNKTSFPIFVSFVLLLLLSFYYPFLTGQKDFYIGDVSLYFEPLCRFIGESLKSGHLPLWNNLSYCGMPQIAIPSPGLFYLPNIVFALFPFSQALALSLTLHQLIAAIGGYLLARSLNTSVFSAAVCGITLALCGYMFSLEANYTLVANAAWLPVCLWSLKKINSSFDLQNAWRIFLSSIFVMQFLSCGRPEITGPGLIMIILCPIVSLFFPSDKNSSAARIKFGFSTLALFLAALLAMPTILPALEWIPLSRRSQGMSAQEAFMYSANWYDYFTMIFGQALGDLHLRWAKFLNLVNTRPRLMPYLSSAYIGPIALTLSFWGISGKDFPYKKLSLIALLVSAIAALGDQTFVMPLMAQLFPVISIVRFPIKFLFFVVFFLSIFAAAGFESIIKGELAKKTLLQTTVIWLLFLIAGFIIASHLPAPGSEPLLQQAKPLLGQYMISGSVIGLAFVGLTILYRKSLLKESLFKLSVPILLAVTLMWTAFSNCRHEAPIHFFDKESSLAAKIHNLEGSHTYPRVAGLYLEQFTCPQTFGSQDATVNWSSYGLEMLRPNCNMDAKLPSIFGYESAMTGKYYDLLLQVYLKSSQCLPLSQTPITDLPLTRFLQMTSTKYAITQAYRYPGLGFPPELIARPDPHFFQLIHEDLKLNARLYLVKQSMPHAYFVNSYRPAENVAKEIEDSEISKFDPHLITLVDKNANSQTHSEPANSLFLPQVVTIDKPEYIEVQANCPEDGLIVLTDQNYPGWQCRVDSKVQDIVRVNSFARGVFVQSGKHTITYEYKPLSLSIGLWCALFAVLTLLLLMGFSLFKRT